MKINIKSFKENKQRFVEEFHGNIIIKSSGIFNKEGRKLADYSEEATKKILDKALKDYMGSKERKDCLNLIYKGFNSGSIDRIEADSNTNLEYTWFAPENSCYFYVFTTSGNCYDPSDIVYLANSNQGL